MSRGGSRAADELNMSGMQYLVNIKDIGKFEHQGKRQKIFPLHITTVTVARDLVSLLYITVGETSHHMNWSICDKPFKSADKKVRYHNHLTGEYRGPAHNACNLNYRIDPKKVKIPCIIHNLKGKLFLC